jgi:PE-PPE domain/PE family
MSYLISAPESLASAAADVENIRSAIGAAGSNAAAPTTGVVAAAGDEVSGAIANLFGAYGREYQELLAQAATFHSRFTQTLAAAGLAYAEAEAANAALVSGVSNEVGAPLRTLLGQAPVGAGGSAGTGPVASMASTAAGDPLYALIMGGTGNPTPDPTYVTSVYNAYIKPNPLFSSAIPQGLFTPEQFWPVTSQLGNMTFGQSVTKGVALLNSAIAGLLSDPSNSAVVFGYSQSATIATDEIRALMAAGSPYQGQLSFVLVGNPNNPVGGILERFPGFYIPFLDVAFNGATPPNSPYPTSIYTIQYDGIADAPQYPLDVLSDVNAVMGYFFVHSNYPTLTATQVGNAVLLPTSPDYTGQTQYYMFPTQNLPLLQPIRNIPFAGPPIADIFQPDLRVLVDLGYADYGPGGTYANVPTPAGLFFIPNPITIIPDLALGAVQGPYGAAVEIGVEAGLASPSLFPNTYPWVPSIAPHLNFSFGPSSPTLLSVLSGALGNVLHLIPAPTIPG